VIDWQARLLEVGIQSNSVTLRSAMSWWTLSRTIPTAIFTILASYALWESHAPYKKRQRLRQTVASIFLVSRSPLDQRAIIISFPAISKPGESLGITLHMSKSG